MSDYRLLALAETVDDVERTRIALQNRLRAHEQGGRGLDITLMRLLASASALEKDATKELERAMKDHPLGPFARRTTGLGLKQMARLIASIGDPYWNSLEDRPRRGPAELWAFCGYVPGQKRQRGVKSNWNASAKMRAFLVAESCMKCRQSPYRAVYDAARVSWADKDVSDGHKHNHALRLTAKAILRDLFVEARAVSGRISAEDQNADRDFDRANGDSNPITGTPGRSSHREAA